MSRSLALKIAATLASLSAIATPSLACRQPPNIGSLIARSYDAVVVVRIETVTTVDPDRADEAWTATAAPIGLIEGEVPPLTIELGHREMRNCREGRAVPTVGEYWVAYIESSIEPDTAVTKAWPLAQARKIDPRFRERLEASRVPLTSPLSPI